MATPDVPLSWRDGVHGHNFTTMLLTSAELDGIARGRITVAFRSWTRPTVKTGGRLRTAIGELEIVRVETCDLASLTVRDAKAAGYDSREALLAALTARAETLYRIEFGEVRADARVALREDDALSAEDLAAISAKLTRLDARSVTGPWTQATLDVIRDHPAVLAATLATRVKMERERFKQNVRKLKELGLTESLEIGYRLSPRGRAYLTNQGATPHPAVKTATRRSR